MSVALRNIYKWMKIGVTLLVLCFTRFGYSHGLPGSELVFKQNGSAPQLSIRFALDDLLFASPSLTFLTRAERLNDLSEAQRSTFSRYLKQHLSLSHEGTPLTYKIEALEVDKVSHAHVGEYQQVTLDIIFDSDQTLRSMMPITLLYDVIMHEVRSHRAEVLLEGSEGNREVLAHFIYQQRDGVSLTHELSPAR